MTTIHYLISHYSNMSTFVKFDELNCLTLANIKGKYINKLPSRTHIYGTYIAIANTDNYVTVFAISEQILFNLFLPSPLPPWSSFVRPCPTLTLFIMVNAFINIA